MRKLYYDPASTVCRPIMMFLLEQDMEVELVHVDLSLGEHRSDWYGAINPNRLVPALDDDGFVLTESATILRYLARLCESPFYPAGARERARVDEALDWFNTGFYRDYGYGYIYPRILSHQRVHEAQVNQLGDWHRQMAERRLAILNDHMIGDRPWVAGEEFTVADLFGAAIVSIGEMVEFDLQPYPNIVRWLENVSARPSWAEANAAFYGWRSAIRAQSQAA